MKIKQLDIRDFGVFQGEKLEELGKGIIVIGGANRSGKTSLMQVLRNIPYGFSQNSNLPPAKFQYDVRCDIETEDGENAYVLLKGFSSPEVLSDSIVVNKQNKNLYNIDKATYRELFTISLDELNKSSNKEESNLQAMLLGAGFKHIIKIPEVAKKLREKASSIGGTRGNPYTKMFKPLAENIKKAVIGRKKSISMMDTYVQKKHVLAQLDCAIVSKESELQSHKDNITKLEILIHNYNLNENKKQLEEDLLGYSFVQCDDKDYNIEKAKALKEQYVNELEQYNYHNYEFEKEELSAEVPLEVLIENKASIISYYNGISGTKEVSKNIDSLESECYGKEEILKSKVKKGNDNWSSFNDVSKINCDESKQSILAHDIEKFKEVEGNLVNCNKKLQDFKIQKEFSEKQIQNHDSLTIMKKYFYLTLIVMFSGIILFFIDKLMGASVIVIGAIGITLYLVVAYSNSKLLRNRNIEIKAQINNINVELAKESCDLESLIKEWKDINNVMDEYRDILKLDGRISVDGIKDSFKTVAYLKEEINQYNILKKKLNNQFSSLSETLRSIIDKFDFNHIDSEEHKEEIILDNIQSICKDTISKVEIIYKQLLLAQKVKESSSKLSILEQEIYKFLGINTKEDIILSIDMYIVQGEKHIKYKNQQLQLRIVEEKLLQAVKSQRIKEILFSKEVKDFELKDENTKLLEILQDLYHQYQGIDSLSHDYNVLCDEVKYLEKSLDTFKNEKQTLKDEIQALNSDEQLLQHEQDIRKARSELRPLAEKYAVYNTAAMFLEKIRENFLINTKDNLLRDASDILSEITSGEYKDIMPMEDLMQGDFKTVMQDESVKESTKELSRGTKEQLFLAVRISRIKEISPSLPVILDDSFVNFDRAHTKNTIKAITKLSKTHQIFVLTCHATLVELIMSNAPEAQYFKLEKGKFTKSLGVDLKNYLEML